MFMKTRTIELEITPQGAVRSNGKNSMYHPTKGKRLKRYVQYKKDLALLMRTQGIENLPGEIEELVFMMPIPNPQVGSKKIKAEKLSRIGNPHQMKPDFDNLIKPILDASGKDDSHVWRCGELKKIWTEFGKGKIIITLKEEYVLSL
jgi:Holliday junction resolvase RusA-like endonuclease